MQLTITDNADGSGGVISVSENDGGGTTNIYTSRFLGTNASRQFVLYGTVENNSSLELEDVPLGAYLALAVNELGAISLPVGYRLTSGEEALQVKLMQSVREYVLSLNLPGVSSNPEHHVISKLPYKTNTDLTIDTTTDTCVWYFPRTEQYKAVDTARNTVVYPVQVLLVRKIGHQTHKGLYQMLMDRQLIGQSMDARPIPDVCDFYECDIQPGEPYNAQHWANGIDVSSIVLRGHTEQLSGVF